MVFDTIIIVLIVIELVLFMPLLIAGIISFICLIMEFIEYFIMPTYNRRPRYKRISLVICDKNYNNYVCLIYNKEKYHFYDKVLYNSVEVGDVLYVSVCKVFKRLYIKTDDNTFISRNKRN